MNDIQREPDMTQTATRKAPHIFWTLTEGRAIFEFGWFYALRWPMKKFPKGDGHPIIVLPGFLTSDRSTRPLRRLFDKLGYKTHGWGLGRNMVFNDKRESEIRALLKSVYEKENRKVSLIGWSLGGVFAREIAKANPEYVRSVITLGSPISGDVEHTSAHKIYAAINGKPTEKDLTRYHTVPEAPPVPTTAIYSKTDGVVSKAGTHQPKSKFAESIQVPASHIGLGVNPLVMYVIAERLAQTEGKWKPFQTTGFRNLVYRK